MGMFDGAIEKLVNTISDKIKDPENRELAKKYLEELLEIVVQKTEKISKTSLNAVNDFLREIVSDAPRDADIVTLIHLALAKVESGINKKNIGELLKYYSSEVAEGITDGLTRKIPILASSLIVSSFLITPVGYWLTSICVFLGIPLGPGVIFMVGLTLLVIMAVYSVINSINKKLHPQALPPGRIFITPTKKADELSNTKEKIIPFIPKTATADAEVSKVK